VISPSVVVTQPVGSCSSIDTEQHLRSGGPDGRRLRAVPRIPQPEGLRLIGSFRLVGGSECSCN
jgi:hypothetical protein